MAGKLIVIEGTDGSGKKTQTRILVKKLKKNYDVKVLDFPQYGKWHACFVEHYLNGYFGSEKEVNPYTASLFYALDRYAISKKMHCWLKEGKIIVANRYTHSNMAHQAGKIKDKKQQKKFLKWLNDMEFNILKIPKPNLVILLYMPSEIGQKLVEKKGYRRYIGTKKDIHEASIKHLKAAEKMYLQLAKEYHWEKINCVKKNKILSRQEIGNMVWQKVKKILPDFYS